MIRHAPTIAMPGKDWYAEAVQVHRNAMSRDLKRICPYWLKWRTEPRYDADLLELLLSIRAGLVPHTHPFRLKIAMMVDLDVAKALMLLVDWEQRNPVDAMEALRTAKAEERNADVGGNTIATGTLSGRT